MNSSTTAAGHPNYSALGAVFTGMAFGLTGCLFSLRKLATVVLKTVVTSDPSLAFQEVSDSLPVPRRLDWNVPFIQLLHALREIRGPVLVAIGGLLLIVLGGLFLFIVTRDAETWKIAKADSPPGDWITTLPIADDPSPAAAEPLSASGIEPYALDSDAPAAELTDETHPASHGLGGEITAPMPEITAPVPMEVPPVAHPAEPLKPPRRRIRWFVPALLYLACVVLLVRYGAPSVSDTMLRYFRTLGTFNQGCFQRIAIPSILAGIALWSGVGLALHALLVRGPRRGQKVVVAFCSAALFGIAAASKSAIPSRTNVPALDWTPAVLTSVPARSPFGVPDGYNAGQLLGKQISITDTDPSEKTACQMVMLMDRDAITFWQEGLTEDGLAASLESAKTARAFLNRRHFETALSWMAIKQMYGVATTHLDTTAAIAVCLLDMERCPHLAQCGQTTRHMLFTCSASPANIALLDRWADERNFVFPTRDSRRLMGMLYERFGLPEKALVWYRRADMPNSFLRRVQNEKPLFHIGRIFGNLTLNGKPLVGIRVGVVPRRLNGLPPDMEPEVMRARAEVVGVVPLRQFPQYHPIPYSLRWISTSCVTDSSGRFELTNLTEGEYTVVFTLPPSVSLALPQDPHLAVANPPPGLTVSYKFPERDLGTIGLSIRK